MSHLDFLPARTVGRVPRYAISTSRTELADVNLFRFVLHAASRPLLPLTQPPHTTTVGAVLSILCWYPTAKLFDRTRQEERHRFVLYTHGQCGNKLTTEPPAQRRAVLCRLHDRSADRLAVVPGHISPDVCCHLRPDTGPELALAERHVVEVARLLDLRVVWVFLLPTQVF